MIRFAGSHDVKRIDLRVFSKEIIPVCVFSKGIVDYMQLSRWSAKEAHRLLCGTFRNNKCRIERRWRTNQPIGHSIIIFKANNLRFGVKLSYLRTNRSSHRRVVHQIGRIPMNLLCHEGVHCAFSHANFFVRSTVYPFAVRSKINNEPWLLPLRRQVFDNQHVSHQTHCQYFEGVALKLGNRK